MTGADDMAIQPSVAGTINRCLRRLEIYKFVDGTSIHEPLCLCVKNMFAWGVQVVPTLLNYVVIHWPERLECAVTELNVHY